MMAQTHFWGGVIAGTAGAILTSTPTPVTVGVIAGAAALIPDIDIPDSKITNVRGIRWLFHPLSIVINKLGGHRGVFHTPALYAALALIMSAANVPTRLIQSFLFGTLSHIALDWLNPAGVPLFWPFSKKRFHLLKIKTDSLGEKLFLLMEQVSCCILLGYQMFFV